jgi:peptide/nickel transport system substrate-binding protein
MTHFWPIWAASDYPDPENLLYPQYHSGNHGSWYSCSFFENDRYDELMDEARGLADIQDRIPIYEELQQILADNAVDVWLFAWHWRIAMLDCVEGYVWQPAGMSSTYLYPMSLGEC